MKQVALSRIATLAFIFTASVAGAFWVGSKFHDYRALPPIVATLTSTESDFGRELEERLRAKFPIGTTEEKLIDFLQTEGFSPDWRRRDELNASQFIRQGVLCNKSVRVLWRSDRDGTLADLIARYESICGQ